MKLSYNSSCCNIHITPPLLCSVTGNLTMHSNARNIEEINDSFVEIKLPNGLARIHPNKLVLDGNKDVLSIQLLICIRETFFLMTNDSFLNINNYIMVRKGSPLKLSLKDGVSESPDWIILQRIYKKYENMKAFW
jgi:hypothetical protein